MNSIGLFAFLPIFIGICSTLFVDVDPGTGVSLDTTDPNITFGNPACVNCTKKVAANLVSFKPFMKSYDYESFSIPTLPMCNKCSFIGLNSIELYGDDCSVPSTTNPNITDYQTNYKWNNLSYICEDCQLNTNPITLLTGLVQELQKAVKSCQNDNPSLNLDPAVKGLQNMIKPSNIPKLLSPQCLVSAIGPPTLANMTINLNVLDLKATITVRKDLGLKGLNRIKVLSGSVVDRNYSNTDASCYADQDQPTVLDACNCVFGSTAFVTVLAQVLDVLLACGIRSNNTLFKSALDSYVICDGVRG